MNQARVEAIERVLALANNLVEGEIEHSWVARPGPVSTMRVYQCPECHLVAAESLQLDRVSAFNRSAQLAVPFRQFLAGRKDGAYLELEGLKLTIGFFTGRFFFDEDGVEVEERSAMMFWPKHSKEFASKQELDKALYAFDVRAWNQVSDYLA